jgi:subfamily B ATP-binding cassette protein MsbA
VSALHATKSPREMLLTAMKAEWRLAVATTVFSGLAAAFEAIGITALIPVLNSIVGPTSPSGNGLPLVGSLLHDQNWTATHRLIAVSCFVLAMTYLRSIFAWLAEVAAVRLRERIQGAVRRGAFSQLLDVDTGWFASQHAGRLVSGVTTDLVRLNFILGTITNMVLYACLVLAYGAALLYISPLLSGVAFVLLACCWMLVRIAASGLRRAGFRAALRLNDLVGLFAERINAVRTIRSLAAEDVELDGFVQADTATTVAREHEGALLAALSPISQSLMTTAIVALIIIGYSFVVSRGQLAGTSLLAFFFALFRLAPTLQLMANARGQLATNWVGVEIIHALVRSDDKPRVPPGPRRAAALSTQISVRDLSYTYPGAAQPALTAVTFDIPRCAMTALVGPSGAGKSTLLDLLLRLMDPQDGAILWDGLDLRDLDPRSLRKRIGIVSQDTFVFHASIRANVAYGLDGSSDSEILEALDIAGARDFVAALPSGLDSVIGERGALLSGGQRQRISIARAILRDPDLLLLDEATSALDPETEQQVNRALATLMADRTVVVVAHRLSTVRRAEQLIVLESGRVVEIGSYDELLIAGGSLARQHRVMFEVA